MKPEKRVSNTVIAIIKNRKGKLLMAGDRRCSWGFQFAQSMEFPKVNKKDNILIGGTGSGDLCSLFVETGGFKFPDKRVKCLNTYMYHTVKPAIHRFLINQHYGVKDVLALPPDSYVELVIGIEGEAWSCTIMNPLAEDTEHMAGDISLGRLPAIPYATGCGRLPALAILQYELRRQKYLTRENLKDALEITAQISPGVDALIDIIQED